LSPSFDDRLALFFYKDIRAAAGCEKGKRVAGKAALTTKT
jgi:hypothetical protein